MELIFTVDNKIMSPSELIITLQKSLDDPSAVQITERKSRFRNVDPTITVALIGAAGASLVALINALALVASKTSEKRIVLQSEKGTRLEIPAETDPRDVDKWIDKLKSMEQEKIHIQLPK